MNRTLFRTMLLTATAVLLSTPIPAGCENLAAVQAPATSRAEAAVDLSPATDTSEFTPQQEASGQTSTETAPASPTPTAKPKPTTTTTTYPVVTGLQVHINPNLFVSTRYEETDPHLIWTGYWAGAADPSCSGGEARYAPHDDDWVTVRFSGVSISLVVVSSSISGMAKITLDGGSPVWIDTYSSNDLYQNVVWSSGGLSNGSHVVTVGPAGFGGQAGAGCSHIVIDAFDVVGTLE